MKTLTTILAATFVALTTVGAFADSRVNSELENIQDADHIVPGSHPHPKKQLQSTTVNTSRSNIHNNNAPKDAHDGGGQGFGGGGGHGFGGGGFHGGH